MILTNTLRFVRVIANVDRDTKMVMGFWSATNVLQKNTLGDRSINIPCPWFYKSFKNLNIMEFGEHEKSCERNEAHADWINFISRQLSKCRELNDTINERKRRLHDLESSISLLQVSTSSKEMNYNVLTKEEVSVRQKCIEAMKASDAMEQELKKLKSERIGHNFWERLTNNAEYFLCAYTEYSSAKLLKDIEWYEQEFGKIQHEFSMRMKDLECLEVENGLNSLISDGAAKEKLEIDASLKDIMLHNSKSTDNKVQKIRIAQRTSTELRDNLNRKRNAQKYILK